MAYRKKPEYGLSDVVASGLTFKNTPLEIVADPSATITRDGQSVPSSDIDVEALYETGPMKK